MKSLPLICIGGGGHCKSVINVAEELGYDIMGILDMPDKVGSSILGYPIIGTDDDIENYVDKAQFIITVGHIKNPNIRIKIYERLQKCNAHVTTIVASTAKVSRFAEIGCGTVVLHNAVVNADTKVGVNCIINTFSNVEHDAVVGDFCHISTGAMVNGNCVIGERTFIGSGSVLSNAIEVPSDSVIGAASFVRKSYNMSGIYSGNPAILKIRL